MAALFGRKKAEEVTVAGVTLRCEICHHAKFWERTAQLHSDIASFFDLEWTGPNARCMVCEKCGYIHWFLPID